MADLRRLARGDSLFLGVEVAEMFGETTGPDVGTPLLGPLIPAHTCAPAGVVAALSAILDVVLVRCFAQVFYPVVRSDLVDVIDLVLRERAGDETPDDSMSLVCFPAYSDLEIAVTDVGAPRDRAGLSGVDYLPPMVGREVVSRSRFPVQHPGIGLVAETFFEVVLRDHGRFSYGSVDCASEAPVMSGAFAFLGYTITRAVHNRFVAAFFISGRGTCPGRYTRFAVSPFRCFILGEKWWLKQQSGKGGAPPLPAPPDQGTTRRAGSTMGAP